MSPPPKYPPLKLAPDWEAKLAAVPLQALPLQAWWAGPDEPVVWVPPGSPTGQMLPHHVALGYGVCVPMEEETDEPA